MQNFVNQLQFMILLRYNAYVTLIEVMSITDIELITTEEWN